MIKILSTIGRRFRYRDEGPGRRKYERAQVRVPFSLRIDNLNLVGNTADVALGGALLQVEEGAGLSPQLTGRSATLEMMLPEGEIQLQTEIVRVEWSAIAVQFVGNKGDESLKTLKSYLETQLGFV